MKWRLQEGRGEAVYQIGVEDNGMLVGLSDEDLKASLKTLRRMAEKYDLCALPQFPERLAVKVLDRQSRESFCPNRPMSNILKYARPDFVFPPVSRVGADITVLREREVDYGYDIPKKIAEVLVRRVPDNQQVGFVFCYRSIIIIADVAVLAFGHLPVCSSWTCEWRFWVMWMQGSPHCWGC